MADLDRHRIASLRVVGGWAHELVDLDVQFAWIYTFTEYNDKLFSFVFFAKSKIWHVSGFG